MDAPIGDEDGCTLAELIADSYDMEAEIFEKADTMAYKLEKYLELLSKRQKEVLRLLSYCYQACEIQRLLHMTQKEYSDAVDGIRSYEKIRILF